MVLDNTKSKETILLAVTPRTQELANSDALEFAKIVDPERERTIGVMTKVDVEGDDVSDILENTHLTLKRGWVGVVNRNNQEIKEGKDMDYITKKERDFFQNSELYSHMAHRMGIPYLQKLLQKTLRVHIKQCLPQVRMDITERLSRFESEINRIESIIGNGPHAKTSYMVRVVQEFAGAIYINIMGNSEQVTSLKLNSGAKVRFQLHTEVQRIISQVLLPDQEEIIKLIANINGIRDTISVPSLAVDCVCRHLIERFKTPLDKSVDCITRTLFEAVEDSSALLNTCPILKEELMYQINKWIREECNTTKNQLKEHIDAEMFHINLNHPNFDSSSCDAQAPSATAVNIWKNFDLTKEISAEEFLEFLSKDEQMMKQVKYVADVSIKYLEIIQVQVSDIAIKYIAYFLVKKVLNAIMNDLVPALLDLSNLSTVTEDCDDEIRRKDVLVKTCISLKEALEAIKNF